MNYKQLQTLYKKEIMDVLRDKKTILTMVVLPVLLYPMLFVIIMQVVSLIQTTQQEQTYHIAYDNVSEENRNTLNDWIEGDQDDLTYVIQEVKSNNPKKDLEDEKIDAYLTMNEEDGQLTYEIHYLSAVSNSSMVSDMLEEEIESFGKHVAEKNAKEQGLNVKSVLYPVIARFEDESSNESAIGSILGGIIPFLMITAILMGAMYPAIDATAGEKERGTLETLLTLPIGNMELIMSKFLSVATISIFSVLMNVISMGGIVLYMYASIKALSEDMGSFHVESFIPAVLISVVCVIAFALFISAVVMCVCAFAKSFKEANNYVTPVTLVVMLTGYIGFIPNVELTSKTALIPVANVCLLMKNLMVFKYDFTNILAVLLSNIIYAFIAVWVLGKIYNSESILFGESASGIKLFERRKNIKKGSLPTVQESILILIVALLMMVYLGGLVSLNHPTMGVIIPQAFIGLLPLFACFYIKGDFKKVFGLKVPKLRYVIGGVFLYIGVGSLAMALSNVLAQLFPQGNEELSESYMEILSSVPFGVGLLLMALLPAICEELLFRGYMYTAFRQKLNLIPAMIWVSILFGVSHMSLIKLIPTAILGCALFYARSKSDSLFVSSLMHFLNNGIAVALMYYGDKIPVLNDETMTAPIMLIFVVLAVIFIPIGVLVFGKKKEQA